MRFLQLCLCLLAVIVATEAGDCHRKSHRNKPKGHKDDYELDEVHTLRFLTPTANGGNSAFLNQILDSKQQAIDALRPNNNNGFSPSTTVTATGTGFGGGFGGLGGNGNTITITTGNGGGNGGGGGGGISAADLPPVPVDLIVGQILGGSANKIGNANRRRRRRPNNNRRRRPQAVARPIVIGRGRSNDFEDDY